VEGEVLATNGPLLHVQQRGPDAEDDRDGAVLTAVAASPVAWGIILAYVVGKPVSLLIASRAFRGAPAPLRPVPPPCPAC
jgi:hypothetical protein